MHQDWSAYRITLLLYLGVLIIPFSFYYTYSAMQVVTSHTAVIQQLGKSGGEMLAIAQTADASEASSAKQQIDQTLQKLKPWITSNSDREFYVGGRTLQEDYIHLLTCWEEYKSTSNTSKALQCWKMEKSLSFTVDKMLSLKQKKIENLFFVTMFLAMVFLLLLTAMVRAFIHKQLQKNSIYDLPTKLYNKNYFHAELKGSCERSIRYQHPLSLLSIEISNLGEKSTYDKKTEQHILKIFGGLITSLTRGSDIACRYSDNNLFCVILPYTSEEGATILKNRVQQKLEDQNFGAYPNLLFKVATTQFDGKETPEAFIARANGLLG